MSIQEDSFSIRSRDCRGNMEQDSFATPGPLLERDDGSFKLSCRIPWRDILTILGSTWHFVEQVLQFKGESLSVVGLWKLLLSCTDTCLFPGYLFHPLCMWPTWVPDTSRAAWMSSHTGLFSTGAKHSSVVRSNNVLIFWRNAYVIIS